MKKIILLLLLGLSIKMSFAKGLVHTSDALTAFAKKNCVLAVARNAGSGFFMNPIYCVLNGKIAEGTMYEDSGCLFVQMDPTTGGFYAGLGGDTPPAPIATIKFSTAKTKGVDCSKELVKYIFDEARLSDFIDSPELGKKRSKMTVRQFMKEIWRGKFTLLTDDFGVWPLAK